MQLNQDEKDTVKLLLKRHLEFFRKEEIKRDVPLKFLQSEEKYEEFLKNLIKKF